MQPILPFQIRAARAMLGWSVIDLARAARLSVSTIKRMEDNLFQLVTEASVRMMQDALETEGVRFLPDDGNGPGLRLRAPAVVDDP